ncbi:HlyD family secretion protein [Phenylobacterium sp.]|jgi:membrane fusion protein (multidrug efflux system)|uniref:HlyD family secretion protein n=1 Tax=Phenylobacterium sp. TaxID=1871053 RepID=UPI002E31C16C|nr:HlyD family secretion protein [Phenylobacterium sp.]HEX3366655.1 HlyD family secretion protein [Phenylobacterium sp.]
MNDANPARIPVEDRGAFAAGVNDNPEPHTRRARYRKPLMFAAPVVAIAGGLFIYLHGGRTEATDDAYVQSVKVQVSANVPGRVVAVGVTNNQQVRTGEMLFRLDPAPYQAMVDEAAAKLASARLRIAALQANYRQGASELKAAQDRLHFAERERDRQQELLGQGISSQAQYDTAALAAVAARQQIETVAQQNASVLASLGGEASRPVDENPIVREAQAALDQANLKLGYTTVRAPQDGIVTRVDQLPVGNYVEASKPVFTLVGTSLWIEANFKEDQLHYMRLGQPATVKLDAFPDLKLQARLANFSPGTGNTFSLLPPENATGNWVKVTQRLPVEFALGPTPGNLPLHAGLSASVTVDTGHRRHLFGGDPKPARSVAVAAAAP